MTVHLVISLLTLGLLCWTLRRLAQSKDLPPRTSWVPLAMAVAVILPLGYGSIIPISHYVFEATSDNVTWYGVVGAGLWGLTGLFLWRCIRRCLGAVDLVIFTTMWAIMVFWYGLGVGLSHYESGPTPAVTDATIYLMHLASVHLVLLGLFFMLFTSPILRNSWLRNIVTAGIFFPYLMIVVSGVADLYQRLK